MRRFLIKVNGKDYDVAVEEIGAGVPMPSMSMPAAPVGPAAPAPAAPAPAASAPEAPAPAAEQSAAPAVDIASVGGTKTESPMPGNILEVRVKVGDTVSEGDVIVILEAMKLENEIMAPCSGKVVAINAHKGDVVNTGDILFVIG